MNTNDCAQARPLFVESLQDFMEVLREDFPNCPDLQRAWDRFELAILDCNTPSIRTDLEDKMIQSFHKNMSSFICRSRCKVLTHV